MNNSQKDKIIPKTPSPHSEVLRVLLSDKIGYSGPHYTKLRDVLGVWLEGIRSEEKRFII